MASPFTQSYVESNHESETGRTQAEVPNVKSIAASWNMPVPKAIPKLAAVATWITRPVLKFIVYFCNVVVFFMMFVMLYCLMKVHLDPIGKWTRKLPPHADFHHISISSSSETCTELAREFAIRDFSIASISFFLASCLLLAEPQSSGFGGASTFVYGNAKTKECIHGTGGPKYANDLKAFYNSLLVEPSSEHEGPYSIAYPMDIRTVAGLYQLAAKQKHKKADIEKVTQSLFNDIIEEEMRLPVSKSLAMAFKAGSQDLQIVTNEELSYLTDGVGSVLREGHLFKPSQLAFRMVKDLVDNKGNMTKTFDVNTWPKYGSRLFDVITRAQTMAGEHHGGGIDVPSFYSQLFRPDLTRRLSNVSRLWNATLETTFGNFSFCSVASYSTTRRSLIVDALFNFNKSAEELEHEPEISHGFYLNIYHSIVGIIEMARQTISPFVNIYTASRKVKQQVDIDMKSLSTLRRIQPSHQYSSNHFAVVDHREQIAAVMIGTLGSHFGSQFFGSEGSIIMNNLMSRAGSFLAETGNHHNDLEPVIVFDGDKIHTAYAGSGGFLTRSLDIPRKLSSLVLSLFWGRKLEESLSIPLYVPVPGNMSYQGPGLPWFVSNRLRARFGRTPRQSDEVDKVAAIQGNRALYFDGSPHRANIMPNGY